MIASGATLLAVLLAVAPALPPDLEARAKAIEGRLMAPCCMANTVALHESAAAEQMRREIRGSLAAGRSEREILDGYVAIHGEQILAMPYARGFNLAAYLLPLGILVAGLVLLAAAMRRWRAGVSPPGAQGAPPVDEASAARLREELRRLG
jgi:cytochrome c-type biogenesis protein CcmH